MYGLVRSAWLLNQNSQSVSQSVSQRGGYRAARAAKKIVKKLQHFFPKKGGGAKAVWKFSGKSSIFDETAFPNTDIQD